MEIPDVQLARLIKDADASVNEIYVKVKCCMAIVSPYSFTSEQMNQARAVYFFKNQERIQNKILKEQREQKKKQLMVAKDISTPPKVILSREETKKRAELVLKYMAEKDTDKSKNRRKPISFRKKFM